jgi:hypothetical protein
MRLLTLFVREQVSDRTQLFRSCLQLRNLFTQSFQLRFFPAQYLIYIFHGSLLAAI